MKQIDPPEPSPSLIDVQLAFAHWRKTRTVRGSTPERLRVLAADLLTQHNAASVCSSLGVNSTALKQWATLVADADEPVADQRAAGFITLPLVDEQAQHAEPEPCALIINLPNGVQVHAQGEYTLSQVFVAVSELSANA